MNFTLSALVSQCGLILIAGAIGHPSPMSAQEPILRATLTGHSRAVTSIAFSSDGAILASGSSDKTVKLWAVATGKSTLTLRGHSDGILIVVFGATGKTLASASLDNTVKFWDVITGKNTATL